MCSMFPSGSDNDSTRCLALRIKDALQTDPFAAAVASRAREKCCLQTSGGRHCEIPGSATSASRQCGGSTRLQGWSAGEGGPLHVGLLHRGQRLWRWGWRWWGSKSQPRATPWTNMRRHRQQYPCTGWPQPPTGLPAKPPEQLVAHTGFSHGRSLAAYQSWYYGSRRGRATPALDLCQAGAR